jgi:hypothetical protein
MPIHDGPLSKLFGPYQVIERINVVTYQLQLPPKAQLHNVFHVAFLKKFEGAASAVIPPQPPIVRGQSIPVPQEVVRTKPTMNS